MPKLPSISSSENIQRFDYSLPPNSEPVCLNLLATVWVATSGKGGGGSSPEEIIEFFQFNYSLQPLYGSGFDSASNWNENQKMFLGRRARPASKADVTATYELIV
jgi:hypothetical protein